ncbi:MAG: response regulator transcription factor [Chloroflexota bacterium]
MDVQQKILVVDDDRQIVRLVREYLVQAGFGVVVAYDGKTAVQLIATKNPHLLILDLGLPDRDGWDVTRQIRGNPRWAKLPIIMLTARIDDMDKVIGLELGADDYITKPFNARELVARVRALLRRVQLERTTPTQLVEVESLVLDLERRSLTARGELVELTPTEFKLLAHFMQHPNATFTREELLDKALGYGYEGMGRTLDSHIKNLRQKIEVDAKRPLFIQTVHRVGYKFVALT